MGIKGRPSNFRQVGDLVYIELSGGRESVIDAVDLNKIRNYKWYCSRSGKKGNYRWYAVAWVENGNGKEIRLPQLLLNASTDEQVDHKNGNTLDNRRENIRISTQRENCQNRRKLFRVCSSVFKGVCWHKGNKKWVAQIRPPESKRQRCLGYFDSEIEAARMYNNAAVKLFGNFARLNEQKEVMEVL